MIVRLDDTVNELLSCMTRCPMFIACVVKPGRISQMEVFAAASLAEPGYDEESTVMSKKFPPYRSAGGIPCGEGRVDALKYGG